MHGTVSQACGARPNIPRQWFFQAPRGRHFRVFRHFWSAPRARARSCRVDVPGGGARVGWRYPGYGVVRVVVRTLGVPCGMGPGPVFPTVWLYFPLFGLVLAVFPAVWPGFWLNLALFGLVLATFGPIWPGFGCIWLYWALQCRIVGPTVAYRVLGGARQRVLGGARQRVLGDQARA